MRELSVVPIDDLDFSFRPRSWSFADERRADIDAHFAARRRKTPQLWNGRVLLLSDWALEGSRVTGNFFETDFASFLAWLDWDCPDRTVTNCFAMGALHTSDDAFLLGVMSAHTASGGRIYFPSGTPDLGDVVGSKVDLAGSVLREMAEETGLASTEYVPQPGWTCVPDGQKLCLIKRLRSDASAAELRARILNQLARETEPELCDIRIARGPADLDPMMPPFIVAFLHKTWALPR
jgi:hypothetical protein